MTGSLHKITERICLRAFGTPPKLPPTVITSDILETLYEIIECILTGSSSRKEDLSYLRIATFKYNVTYVLHGAVYDKLANKY